MKQRSAFARIKFGGREAERGFALLVVLWAIVFLSVLAVALFDAVRVESQATLYRKEATQAYALARGAVDAAIFQLAYPSPAEKEGSHFWQWQLGQRENTLSFGGGKVELRIVNASGLVDLNRASSEQLAQLFRARGLKREKAQALAASIVEWRSPAESEPAVQVFSPSALAGDEPVAPFHRPFRSVEEVLNVPGMTRGIFYGTAEFDEEGKIQSRFGVGQDLTVFSGSNQINVNYASEPVLESVPGITSDLVRAIVQERAKGPFASLDEVGQRLSVSLPDESLPYLTTGTGPTYTIIAVGRMKGSRVRRSVEAVVEMKPQGSRPYRVIGWCDDDPYLGD
jgi:general secretion pathway protein K